MDFTRCWTQTQNWKESFCARNLRTFEIFTNIPSGHPPLCPAAGLARRRRGRARPHQQARGIVDWAYQLPIGGGGLAGEDSGERRRRSSGGAPAGSSTAVRNGLGSTSCCTGSFHVTHGRHQTGHGAWRSGEGASSTAAVRRRPRRLGLR
jgi:hypothetical protein